jgi:hypothetical protein
LKHYQNKGTKDDSPSACPILVILLTEGFTQLKDLTKIQSKNQGEIGGEHYEKQNAPQKMEKMKQIGRGAL